MSIGSVETPSGSGNYGTVTVTLKPGASTVTFSGLKYEGEEATITLDPSGLIDESDESNNSFTIETPASCRASSGNCEEAERDKDLLSARLATVSIAVASVDGLLTPETLNPAKSQVNRAIRDLEGLGDDIEDLFSAHTPAAQRALQEARQLYGNALNALERALDKIEQAIKTSRNPEGRHIVESLLEEASKLLQQADLALNRLDFEIFKFDVCG